MDVDYLLTATRSVRKAFDLGAPVDPSALRDCLRIACQAPNGSNQQPWRWLVVRDPKIRAELGRLYRAGYEGLTGRQPERSTSWSDDGYGRLMSSVEWLVEHLAEVPVHVIPCYRPYMGAYENGESFQRATLYGSIFPAVWNFQLALHSRGYGSCVTTTHLMREKEVRDLLGIPDTYIQGCLLPVGRLPAGKTFGPAPRRPIEEVVALDRFDGPPL
jgi:nitroreductase